MWFQWEDKQDGNWHECSFMGPYATKLAAENAMRHRLNELKSRGKLSCFKTDQIPEMRVRNVVEKG